MRDYLIVPSSRGALYNFILRQNLWILINRAIYKTTIGVEKHITYGHRKLPNGSCKMDRHSDDDEYNFINS